MTARTRKETPAVPDRRRRPRSTLSPEDAIFALFIMEALEEGQDGSLRRRWTKEAERVLAGQRHDRSAV